MMGLGMVKDKARERIGELLRDNGFGVDYIPEEQGRNTADLKAVEGQNTYYIEVKSKGDDQEELQRERESLERGEIVNRSESLGRDNSLSAIIRFGAKQLRDYPSSDSSFKLVWVHAEGDDPDLQHSQVRGTLYGAMHLIDLPGFKLCYYFTFNEFFNLRNELDGVIVSTERELQLCINDLSPRAKSLRSSGMYRWLQEGICDPEAMELAGEIYSACDYNASRKDSNAVLEFVREKYGKPQLIPIQMRQNEGRMLLRTEPPESRESD
jgi:hypothetical protein